MRIAFMLDSFPCLSETFILNQITGLMDRGHQIQIFANAPKNEGIVHEDVKRYGLLDRTCYLRSAPERLRMRVSIPSRVIKGAGLLIRCLSRAPRALLNSLNVIKYGKEALSLQLFYKALVFIDKGSFDVVYCHFGPIGLLGARLKGIGAIDAKLITSFHGYDVTKFLKLSGEDAYRPLFSRGDLFLPVSEKWKETLIRLGCNKDRIVVHRMGIDIERFTFLPRKPEGSRVNLLTVARLTEKKGIPYAIEAVSKVLRLKPNLEYMIVGDGPLRNDIEALISKLHLKEKVKLLGPMPQEKIVGLMKRFHIFLAPSVTAENGDQEGIPVVLMEAMASGMPVISSRHSGIPELVAHGRSGFLVEERDSDALAERLSYLIDHPELWPEMGRAGRKIVEEKFNILKLNDELVETYGRLLYKVT